MSVVATGERAYKLDVSFAIAIGHWLAGCGIVEMRARGNMRYNLHHKPPQRRR